MRRVKTPAPLPSDAATMYALDVLAGRVRANRYVKLACERHLNDLRRTDVWYDPRAAEMFYCFCERYLTHYKGPMRGQAIKLERWQKFIFGNIYGWKQVIDGVKTDLWRFNINYIEVPRKNGKTTICAAGAAFDCLMVEETGAEVYCLATKEDQAKILYNDVAAFIGHSPELSDAYEILKGKNTIYSAESMRTSFIKPLGADSSRLDGLNPFSTYADELHAWPKADLWEVIMEAFGARDNWHLVAITTAGSNKDGICYKQREHVIDILEGRMADDRMFGIVFTVDADQRENWQVEEQWFVANPNLGHGKQLKYIRDQANTALQMPSALNSFLNKQLNIWTDATESWLSSEMWKARGSSYSPEFLQFKRCSVAFDLSRVNDLSAVAYVFPVQGDLTKMHVWVDFYLPRFGLREKSLRDRVDYELWEKQGWLTVTPGKTTDYEFIRRDINKRAEIFQIEKIGYDRHFAGELVSNLANDGFSPEPVGMGYVSMSAPSYELERLLVEDQITHPQNPLLTWNAACVIIKRDEANNIKPDKAESTKNSKHIDGIVAIIMALYDILQNQPQVSKYEQAPMVVVGSRPKKRP